MCSTKPTKRLKHGLPLQKLPAVDLSLETDWHLSERPGEILRAFFVNPLPFKFIAGVII
jgi:hypothetical protein